MAKIGDLTKMIFHGDLSKLGDNVPEKLKPLLEAIKSGKAIKSVTCMRGTMNKNNPDLDFKIENFTVTDYYIGFSAVGNKEHDFVETNSKSERIEFYVNWVREFEI